MPCRPSPPSGSFRHEAVETLVEQALHLPRREARRWRHVPLEQEELVADGNPRPRQGRPQVRPSYGVPFPAFATPYVRGAIVDTVRSRARRNRLSEGVYADVVGFSDVSGRGERGEITYEPTDPSSPPDDEPSRANGAPACPRDDPGARADRSDPHDRGR